MISLWELRRSQFSTSCSKHKPFPPRSSYIVSHSGPVFVCLLQLCSAEGATLGTMTQHKAASVAMTKAPAGSSQPEWWLVS